MSQACQIDAYGGELGPGTTNLAASWLLFTDLACQVFGAGIPHKAKWWSMLNIRLKSRDHLGPSSRRTSSTRRAQVKSGQSRVRLSYSPPSPHTLLPKVLNTTGSIQ